MTENKGNSGMQFIKNTFIFFVGNVLSKLISFILLPMYTTVIPTEQMGVYDVSVTLTTMLLSVCYFEIWSAVLRYLYDGKTEKEKNRVLKSGVEIFLVASVIFVIVSIIVSTVMRYNYTLLIAGYGIAYGISSLLTFVARGLGKNKEFSLSGVINTLMQLSLNVLLLTVVRMDYSALYISYIIGTLCQTIYLTYCTNLRRRLREQTNRDLTIELLKYALPLCLNTVAYWALNSSNRLVYNALYGNSASGIYSIGNRFGSIIALATTCFTYAWQDLAFTSATGSQQEACNLYTKACNKYQQFLTVATVLLLPIIKIAFPFFIKGDYASADEIIPTFIIVAVISGYSAFIGNVFYAIKDTKVISISTIIAAVVNILICYPLIKCFGAFGTNLAIIVAFAVNIGIRTVILKKRIGFSICLSKIIISIIWIICSSAIYSYASVRLNVVGFISSFILATLLFYKDLLDIFVSLKNKRRII